MIDMREEIAAAVAVGVRRHFTGLVKLDHKATTSDCPVVELTFESGDVYNLTITKARRKDAK